MSVALQQQQQQQLSGVTAVMTGTAAACRTLFTRLRR